MATAEERLKVLKMLEAGTITTDEARQLLTALGAAGKGPAPAPGRELRALHIRVREAVTGRAKATASIPLPVVDSLLRWVGRAFPNLSGGRWQQLRSGIQIGQAGKLLELSDAETGDSLELAIE